MKLALSTIATYALIAIGLPAAIVFGLCVDGADWLAKWRKAESEASHV